MSSRNFRSGPSAPNRSVAPFHRGPQAQMTPVPTAGSGYAPVMTKNAALLIDFDNVTMGIRSDLHSELKNLLSSDIIKGKPAVQRAYADWRRYPQYIVPLTESSIDLIFAPAYGTSKKNATDIRLAIDALELVFTRPDVTTFILLSGDSDFSSLVIKLKEYGKYVIGVGIRESSSDLLVMNCDEYYSYNALAGLVKTTEEESTRWDPWALVTEAVTRMKRNGDVMRSDRLKQVMQEIDNSFDEKNLGHPKFSRFVQEAASKGLLSVTKLESGQLEVDAPEGDAAAAPAADGAAEGRSESRPDRARGERTERAERTDRPERERGERERDEERRGRRGRRGRGRDRGERGEGLEGAEGAEGAEGEITETEVAVAAGVESAATPAFEAPSFGAAVGGAVGTSGDRLTRSEAFDLVRQAVESLVQGDDATSASATRQRAFELLGRDSESLSARNFDRVLQDAHDAGMIDLRRRGDDFEVARAAEAASIVEQLKTAEGAAKANEAAKTPAAPTHRGMSHRGVAGRGAGRGKGMAPPPELLMVGVVPRAGGAVVAGNGTSTTASTPAAGASTAAAESATATTSTAVADASAPGSDVTAATEAAGAATAPAPARGGRGGTRGAKTAAPSRAAKTPAKRAAKEAAAPAAPAAKRPAKAAKSAAQAPAPAAAKKAAKGAKKAAKTARR